MEKVKCSYKKIMFVGPQGSGKTTQAKMLAEKLGYEYLGTGEMLRGIVQRNESGAEMLKKIFSEGKLVDDQTTCKLVQETLSKPEYQNGIIMDGYPRTIEQKNIFDPDFDIVFYIKVSDETAVKRLISRGRFDDTGLAIQERLALYHQETGPLVDIFLSEGKLWIIDGEQPIDVVSEHILHHLEIEN